MFTVLLTFVVAFLLGSIPSGVIISKVFFHTDIRDHGSGNIGTTNAMRALGKKGGAAVFLLDFGKGLVSGLIGMGIAWNLLPGGGVAPGAVITYQTIMAVATMGCTLGHIFSPWLKFRGGKGIATAIGALFVAFGPLGACIELFVIFGILVAVTRYVSVGSIVSAAACPFIAAALFWGEWPAIIMYGIVGATVVWAHRENIKRLLSGTERRIGGKKEGKAA